jgi:ribosomal 30S subunit maturation factor RimM
MSHGACRWPRAGRSKAAHDFGAGDLVEVQPPTGQSYFLPFTEDVFTDLDMERACCVSIPIRRSCRRA